MIPYRFTQIRSIASIFGVVLLGACSPEINSATSSGSSDSSNVANANPSGLGGIEVPHHLSVVASPSLIDPWECLPVRLELRSVADRPALAPNSGINTQLNTVGRALFYTSSVCTGAALGQFKIPAGQSNLVIYMRKARPELLTVTASATGLGSAVFQSRSNGDGSQSALLVSAPNQVINSSAHLTAAHTPAGSTSINVSNASFFAVGGEIMILQTQNGVSPNRVGYYEFNKIVAINGNSIDLSAPLGQDFDSNVFLGTPSVSAQIISVPRFSNLTVQSGASIVTKPYDGYDGGVIAFRAAGTVSIDGLIDVTGKGFRGGLKGSLPGVDGKGGESSLGVSPGSRRPNGSGGGGAPSQCVGGGGGGAGQMDVGVSAAGNAWSAPGGLVSGAGSRDFLIFGSGGGGGGAGSCNSQNGGDGGTGAGAIFIAADTLSGSGFIKSNGRAGTNVVSNGGGGGGGAGGSVVVITNQVLAMAPSHILASGGSGGLSPGGYAGGAGSIGSVQISTGNAANTILALDQVLNAYAAIIESAVVAGSTSVSVEDALSFSVGDKVLLMQVQDGVGGSAGFFEVATIQSINASKLFFSSGLVNSYVSGSFGSSSAQSAQVVRIASPSSLSVTATGSVTAPAWNGYRGGVVAVVSNGDIDIQGSLKLANRGFKAGEGGYSHPATVSAFQGEGPAGLGSINVNSVQSSGGGGTSGCTGSGGGGGGHGSPGQDGTSSIPGRGGSSMAVVDATRLLLGPGGGGGGAPNTVCNWGFGSFGGAGGGALYLDARSLNVNGSIIADGKNGEISTGTWHASGGGGAGGSIFMNTSATMSVGNGLVTSLGGTGGVGGTGNGGDGGVGRIHLTSGGGISGAVNPSPF